jgi:hypothetical protein
MTTVDQNTPSTPSFINQIPELADHYNRLASEMVQNGLNPYTDMIDVTAENRHLLEPLVLVGAAHFGEFDPATGQPHQARLHIDTNFAIGENGPVDPDTASVEQAARESKFS